MLAQSDLRPHTVLAAFDTSGAYIGDILVVPNDPANGGNGVLAGRHWRSRPRAV
jgi:hypothetical protein